MNIKLIMNNTSVIEPDWLLIDRIIGLVVESDEFQLPISTDEK